MAHYGLTAEDGKTQIWYIDQEVISGGAAAVNDVLSHVWWARPFTYLYRLPGIRQIQDWAYKLVADNRHRMPGGTAACEIMSEEKQ